MKCYTGSLLRIREPDCTTGRFSRSSGTALQMCRITSRLGRPAAVVLKPRAGLAGPPGWKAARAPVGHATLLGRARCALPGPRECIRARLVSRSWAAFEAAVAGPLPHPRLLGRWPRAPPGPPRVPTIGPLGRLASASPSALFLFNFV